MAAPKKTQEEKVRFYFYGAQNIPCNPYFVISSKTYIDPATRRTEIDPLSVKSVQVQFGTHETSDPEVIKYFDTYNAKNPGGTNVSREFLQELKEGETIVEKVVPKKVLPLNVANMFDKKTLVEVLLNEYGFDTDATDINDIITAATEAGVIVE